MKYKKIFLMIILFLLLFQESIQRTFPTLTILDYYDEIIVLLVILKAFLKVITLKEVPKESFLLFLLLLFFFAIGSISLFKNSTFIFSRYLGSSFLAIKCFLLIISVSIIGIKEETKNNCISILNGIGILSVIIGIFNFLFPVIYSKIFPFAIVTYRFNFVSVTSLFFHTGRFGWFMLFLSLMNYVLYKNNNNSKNKKMFIIFGFFSLLSFRTKVILSIIAILFVNLYLSKKIELKKIIIALSLSTIIFIIFNDIILNTYNLYIVNDQKDISARQIVTQKSFVIAKEYFPFGVGFGQYGSFYAKKYYSKYYYKYKMYKIYGLSPTNPLFATDNFWGAILGETGCIGTILYITFIVYIFVLLKKSIIKYNKLEIYFGILALIQSLVESTGEQSFNSPPQYIFLAYAVGIALYETIKLQKKEGEQNEKEKNIICNT